MHPCGMKSAVPISARRKRSGWNSARPARGSGSIWPACSQSAGTPPLSMATLARRLVAIAEARRLGADQVLRLGLTDEGLGRYPITSLARVDEFGADVPDKEAWRDVGEDEPLLRR